MVAGGQRCALLFLALAAGSAALGKRSPVKVLSDGMWQELLQGEWMVEFYAPWCPACQSLQPEWEKFAEWGEDLEVNVAKVDVTEQPGLSGRFIITALPTIYHCKDGEFRRYQGGRTKTDFINFISDQEWKSIEPVSSWFGPSSFLSTSRWFVNSYLSICGTLHVLMLDEQYVSFVSVVNVDQGKLAPESAQLLKKLDEEQEADKEDISDDETEGKEVPSRNSSPSAVRQRPVNPAPTMDKS
ncbi:Tmx1 [Columba guinea]|nr:Tmx1 [Columba guinea]